MTSEIYTYLTVLIRVQRFFFTPTLLQNIYVDNIA